MNILIECFFAIGDPTYLDPEHDYIEVTRRQTSYLDSAGNVGYDDENDIVTEDEQNINGCQAPISFTDVPIHYTESVVLWFPHVERESTILSENGVLKFPLLRKLTIISESVHVVLKFSLLWELTILSTGNWCSVIKFKETATANNQESKLETLYQ